MGSRDDTAVMPVSPRWPAFVAMASLSAAVPLACTERLSPSPPLDASFPYPDVSVPPAPDTSLTDTSVASEAEAGPPVLEVIGHVSQPDQLVASSTFLYVTQADSAGTEIVRCPLAGCGSAPTLVIGNLALPGGLAVTGNTLFWSESFNSIKTCDVTTVPCVGTVFVDSVDDSGGGKFPTQLWINGGHLYWMEETGSDRTMLTCPVAGCSSGYPKTVLFATTGSPLSGAPTSGLAIDGSFAYIALFSGGPILRYAMTSAESADPTSETNLGTTASATHVLDLDGTTLRWAESNDGRIAACTTPGCSPVITAVPGRTTPYAVAHDATYIYGVDKGPMTDGGSDGTLWRIAKQ
jgi:hypothetical protein